MEQTSDIRWIQRFRNFQRALSQLSQAVAIISDSSQSNSDVDFLLREGLIQRFEYTHELAWKVMKDYEEYQGWGEIRGSRDAFRKALELDLIDDRRWIDSIEDRNLTSHNYDEATANDVYQNIVNIYYPLLLTFEQKMEKMID